MKTYELITTKTLYDLTNRTISDAGVLVKYLMYYDGYCTVVEVVDEEKFTAFLLNNSDYILDIIKDE